MFFTNIFRYRSTTYGREKVEQSITRLWLLIRLRFCFYKKNKSRNFIELQLSIFLISKSRNCVRARIFSFCRTVCQPWTILLSLYTFYIQFYIMINLWTHTLLPTPTFKKKLVQVDWKILFLNVDNLDFHRARRAILVITVLGCSPASVVVVDKKYQIFQNNICSSCGSAYHHVRLSNTSSVILGIIYFQSTTVLVHPLIYWTSKKKNNENKLILFPITQHFC